VLDHPEIREEVKKKDEQLAGFLKGMVVNPERMGEVRDVPSDCPCFFICAHCIYTRRLEQSMS